MNCDASISPIHGSVGTCTSKLSVGQSCTPKCDSGFTGNGERSCRVQPVAGGGGGGGVVLDNSFKCIGESCIMDQTRLTKNHMIAGDDCSNVLASGNSCVPTCQDGYESSEQLKATCTKGIFVLTGTCNPLPPPPSSRSSRSVSSPLLSTGAIVGIVVGSVVLVVLAIVIPVVVSRSR